MNTVGTSLNPFCLYCGSSSPSSAYCCSACEKLHNVTSEFATAEPQNNPFSYLDKPDFRAIYTQPDPPNTYIFYAEGLHCSSCVHLLEKLPQFYHGIISAYVNFALSTVTVSLTPEASLAQVAYVIRELGYTPSVVSPNDPYSEKFKAENRKFLKRIAVAGFCAGNTMLFVIPVYSGVAGPLKEIFNWMSFVLFLPILFYSAQPFFRGALNSLKYRTINVDLPIAIAMLSGFIFSTVNLLRGDGDIYFDSTASFLFFILSARYLLKRVQQSYLSPAKMPDMFRHERYLRLSASGEETIPFESVKKGDHLKVLPDQVIPSDAELISQSALIDMALLNGESLPKHFSKTQTLFGGSKVLNREIHVTIASDFQESRMGKLFQQLQQGRQEKNSFVTLTDRLAQVLIATVFGIAVLFFIVYANIDTSQAFNRSLALIVLACPCALAFGSPLAFGLALRKAQRRGILIKNSASLEKILEIKNYFFDKTGTLTEGQLTLDYTEPAHLDMNLRSAILSLEATSYHPLAFAIRKAWHENAEYLPCSEQEEILGQGVKGKVLNDLYEIRSIGESCHESETAVEVSKNGAVVCRLYFKDSLRPDSPQAVRQLHLRGAKVFILSGDKRSRVHQVAEMCEIPRANAKFELFPEDKKSFLENYSQTCMIGDGANDSLALQRADVGIAVKGSMDLSFKNSDVYFTRGGLGPLFDLLTLAEQTKKTLIRNIGISLVYNTIGGTLALMGLISPMAAAILMPISSIAIILSSIWGFK